MKLSITKYVFFFQIVTAVSFLGSDCKKNPVIAEQHDTTSHNWLFVRNFLGDGGGSRLKDVVIINDSLAYAVGIINRKDTAGNWIIPPANVAKWDGKSWEYYTIKSNCRFYYPYCGPETLSYSPGYSITAFGPNNIWLAAGGIHHFDGINWTEEKAIKGAGGANRLCSISPGSLWAVGNSGFIARRHSNGMWEEMNSGTQLDIHDIYGSYDNHTSQYQLLAVASDLTSNINRKVFQIDGSTVTAISTNYIQWPIIGLWFVPNEKYYIGGVGMYEKQLLSDQSWNLVNPIDTNYYIVTISGNHRNDVVAAGGQAGIFHYNGQTWLNYSDETSLDAGGYGDVEIKNDLIVAVGAQADRAIFTIGRRKP